MRHTLFTYRFLTTLLLCTLLPCIAVAREVAGFTANVSDTTTVEISVAETTNETGDSIVIPTSATRQAGSVAITPMNTDDALYLDSLYRNNEAELSALSPDSSRVAMKRQAPLDNSNAVRLWKPDPSTATWLALVIPGGGQIYNRKYWKLPIVYGGFVGCLYAYNWNGQMYKDYRQAYLDIMDSDPSTDSYKDFFRPGYDFDANKEYLKEVFRKRKDRYRRWRDLSVFATIAVYALSVIDAYVDAQLASFDISEDINLTIEPQMMRGNGFSPENSYYGLNCNITF